MTGTPSLWSTYRDTLDWIMRIKIFISVLWSLHNMPHAWEAHGQKRVGVGIYKYRPLLVNNCNVYSTDCFAKKKNYC